MTFNYIGNNDKYVDMYHFKKFKERKEEHTVIRQYHRTLVQGCKKRCKSSVLKKKVKKVELKISFSFKILKFLKHF